MQLAEWEILAVRYHSGDWSFSGTEIYTSEKQAADDRNGDNEAITWRGGKEWLRTHLERLAFQSCKYIYFKDIGMCLA